MMYTAPLTPSYQLAHKLGQHQTDPLMDSIKQTVNSYEIEYAAYIYVLAQ